MLLETLLKKRKKTNEKKKKRNRSIGQSFTNKMKGERKKRQKGSKGKKKRVIKTTYIERTH